jgi:UDP-N-acetyl-D-galactosamine dehydrogenase
MNTTVYDPWADPEMVLHEYGWESVSDLGEAKDFDAVILAVAHNEFKNLDLRSLCKGNRLIYDVKGMLSREIVDARL